MAGLDDGQERMNYSVPCLKVFVERDARRVWRCPLCHWQMRMTDRCPNAGIWSCPCGAIVTFKSAAESIDDRSDQIQKIYEGARQGHHLSSWQFQLLTDNCLDQIDWMSQQHPPDLSEVAAALGVPEVEIGKTITPEDFRKAMDDSVDGKVQFTWADGVTNASEAVEAITQNAEEVRSAFQRLRKKYSGPQY